MIDPVGDRRPPISPQLAWRVALLGGIALALFAIVFFRLWYLQVLSGDQYLAEANDNQVRQERIQAPRGDVVDRNGETIVTNRRAIVVEISPAGLPEAEREAAATWGQRMTQRSPAPDGLQGRADEDPDIPTQELRDRLRRLAGVLEDTTATEIQRRIIQSLAQVPYAPIRVETDVPRSVMNYMQERQTLFPGVTVEQVYLRQYPRTTLAAQLLGTVGRDPAQAAQVEALPRRQAGHGRGPGRPRVPVRPLPARHATASREIQVDALGNPKGELRERARRRPGSSLKLSLDLALQQRGAGGAHRPGQPAAGSRLRSWRWTRATARSSAMGSYPSLRPATCSTKPITQEKLRRALRRAGGLAAVQPRDRAACIRPARRSSRSRRWRRCRAATITPATRVDDTGCVEIGDRKLLQRRAASANGAVDLPQALKVSSDVYFYTPGPATWTRSKGQPLQTWARKLGFGRDTGIDLPGEAAASCPTARGASASDARGAEVPQEAARSPRCGDLRHARRGTIGDNVNLAVGQGDLQATPLQMAVAYSTLANGGARRAPAPRPGDRRRARASSSSASSPPAGPPRQDRPERAPGDHGRACRPRPARPAAPRRRLHGLAAGPLPVYGKTGTAQRHRPSPTSRGTSPTCPTTAAEPDRRRGDVETRRLRRRGGRAGGAADPVQVVRRQKPSSSRASPAR